MTRVQIVLKRFDNAPGDIGIEYADLTTAWHLWQEGDTIDMEIKDPDPWGKHSYPMNWDRLRGRNEGRPVCGLNMEIGRSVYNYRDARDRERLEHVGIVVDALGGVDHIYGHGWIGGDPDDEEQLRRDLAVWALTGCPRRLAVSCYGPIASVHGWMAGHGHKVRRADRLAASVVPIACPLLYITPQGRTVRDWRLICVAANKVARHFGGDLMIWWDGGVNRFDYSVAEPYVDAARKVFND